MRVIRAGDPIPRELSSAFPVGCSNYSIVTARLAQGLTGPIGTNRPPRRRR
jgi:hypothetical protein